MFIPDVRMDARRISQNNNSNNIGNMKNRNRRFNTGNNNSKHSSNVSGISSIRVRDGARIKWSQHAENEFALKLLRWMPKDINGSIEAKMDCDI